MSEAEVRRIFDTAVFSEDLRNSLTNNTNQAIRPYNLTEDEVDAFRIGSAIAKDPDIAVSERYATLVKRVCDILKIEWREGFTLTRRGPSKLV